MSKFPFQKMIKYAIYEGKYKFRNLQNSQEFVSVNGLFIWEFPNDNQYHHCPKRADYICFTIIEYDTFIKEILFMNKKSIDSVIFTEV